MTKRWTVQSAAAAPDDFAAWRADAGFSAIDAHPIFGAFGRRYYPAVYGDARTDESFAVLDRGRPALLVMCTAGEGRLDYFGTPARLFARADLDKDDAAAATEAAFAQIDSIAARRGLREVRLGDHEGLGTLSPVGRQCLNRGGAATVRLNGWCDLSGGEAAMRRGLRKSFASLINWGRRHLEISIVGKANPDRSAFERYRAFHAAVAGRVTREGASWDAMFDWIAAGRGELVLGALDGELVAGTMVVDGDRAGYYASGVYDRDRFDKPLAHWPLWLAMLRGAERGLAAFDLGDLPLPGQGEPKEVAIGYFKRGFAGSIATWLAWRWEISQERRPVGSPAR